MEEALIAYIAADTSVAALLSSRIQWGINLQGSALPRATLQVISRSPEYSDEGEAGLTESRVQVDCYGATYTSAKSVARAVCARVSGAAFTQNTIEFPAVFVESERDSTESFEGGREAYRVSIDLMVWHRSE